MTATETIRRRADGSIDTAYYQARGRRLRARQFHDMTHPKSRGWRGFALISLIFATS